MHGMAETYAAEQGTGGGREIAVTFAWGRGYLDGWWEVDGWDGGRGGRLGDLIFSSSCIVG